MASVTACVTKAWPRTPLPRLAALVRAAALVLATVWSAFGPFPRAEASCLPVAGVPDMGNPGILLAALRPSAATLAALSPGTVELTFLGHSSFLIRSAEGATAVTDFNDYVRAPLTPDIVTMNNAHDTHFTENVPLGVQHVLRGWSDADGPRLHNVRHRDLHVRNVPTNVRDWRGTRYSGNSIFVFETADLCIAHLGHLHHTLTPEHLAALGAIDVLLTPVDGSFTIAQTLMLEVIQAIRPSLVIPMHYFGPTTLARFLDLLRDRFEVRLSETPVVTLSRPTLPQRQVLVLPGH